MPHEGLAILLLGSGLSCAQLSAAACDAALAPGTWIPVAGAALLAATGTDHDLSDWARDRAPLYGSSEDAADASDAIRDLGLAEAVLLESWHLWAARDRPTVEWLGPPAAALGSAVADEYFVRSLKRATDRERPSGADALSFPSSHAAGTAGRAFAASEIVRRDFGATAVAPAWIAGNHALVAAGAWARVEAGAHHPTDVLAGAAIGHFLAHFAHGLLPGSSRLALEAWADPEGAGLALRVELAPRVRLRARGR